MTVCLVRPPILVPDNNPIVQFTPPIGVAYVAGALRAEGIEVTVVDGLGEALDQRHEAEHDCHLYGLHPEDLVAMVPRDARIIAISAAFTFEWPTCRDLIARLRAHTPKALLVAGGEHVTALPELSLEESALDVAVLGEGEETMVALATAYLSGDADLRAIEGIAFKEPGTSRVHVNERHARIRAVDEIPWPAWDLLPIEAYLDREMGFGVNRGRSMPVMASRGCPYQCTFCSSPRMWTTRWVARDPDRLLDELAHYQQTYAIENFDFYDLTAIVKKSWIVTFCARIRERGMRFTWQLPSGTRTEAIDSEVARLLFESGCRNLSYSPESGSASVLERIKKRIKVDRVIDSAAGSVRAGLNVKCNIMMGFPGESWREIGETFRFIVRLAWSGTHDLSIWAFSPYPGSELFDELESQGVLHIDDEYYDQLRSYADASRTTSFSENISSRQLKAVRTIGTLLFYGVSWGRRPWRPFRSVWNVVRGQHESRSEHALWTLIRRFSMASGKTVG